MGECFFANLVEYSGEASWFLIGPTFLREPSWKYSSSYIRGSKNLRWTCSGNIRPIGRSLPLIGWEQSSPVNGEKTKIKMADGVARFFTRFASKGICLFVDLCWLVEGAALSRRTQNEIVVSWITMWGMIKVYWLDWLDFSLHFPIMLSAARLPQVRAEACISLQARWEWSKVWTVRTIFGELNVQLRNES